MTSNTVILFGSCARGDSNSESDVDILIIKNDAFPESVRKDNIEIQVHSRSTMMEKAEGGDLFAMHIAMDGVVLSDPDGFFISFKEACKLRVSYERERREALILAAFISLDWRSFLDVQFLNKRIAWCVRTVLIAEAAEAGRLVFSPRGLVDFAKPLDVSPLIDLRRSSVAPAEHIDSLRDFVISHNGGSYLNLSRADLIGLLKGFGPSVAMSTLRNVLSHNPQFSY